MAIINLKEILISDGDNIKLDKVNYNFDQLVVNGGGPQGFQGNPGTTGYQGITGYQGNQGIDGDQGFQGDQGSSGQDIWKVNLSNSTQADTILPIHIEGQEAPSVLIGYKTTDDEYSDTFIETDSQFVINRNTPFFNNLELKTSGFETTFAFKLDQVEGSDDAFMQMYFVGGEGSINQYANTFTWREPNTAANLISLNATALDININTVFEKDVEIKGNLKISTGEPAAGKIAISADAIGTIEFKNIEDIGGTVPLGTIISMLPAYFEANDKFISSHTVAPVENEPINIYVGRGVNEYAGWYICNGKTWTNGTVSFDTPDLNSFSWDIQDNPNSINLNGQGATQHTNDEIPIIGGADVLLEATYNNGTSLFDVVGTVESSADLIQSNQTGTVFTIKRLPQIIYLGKENLTWSDKGTNQAPTTTVFYNFVDQSSVEPTAQTETYNVTALSGTQGTFNVSIPAPQGQYWDNDNHPVINVPANYTINNTSVNASEYNQNFHITVGYSSHPNTSGNVTFTYNSNGSIVVTPIEEELSFEFYDTYIDPNSITLSIQVTDTNGTNGYVSNVGIEAPAGQYWTSMPTITTPTGFAITNPSLQITNGSDYENVYQFTVTYDSFPYSGPVDFTYSSYMNLETIPEVEMKYTISGGITKGSLNREQTITAGLGSTVTLSEITLKAAIDNYWRIGTNTVLGSSSTYNNGSPILRSDDFTIISSELDYVAGDAYEQPSLLKLIIQDSDFGNETETPGGIDGTIATNININHPYDQISSNTLYVENGISKGSWDYSNSSSWNNGLNEQWRVVNETEVTQYIKIMGSYASSTSITASLDWYTQSETGDLSILNDYTSETTVLSSGFITINANDVAEITWTNVEYTNNNGNGGSWGIYLVATDVYGDRLNNDPINWRTIMYEA